MKSHTIIFFMTIVHIFSNSSLAQAAYWGTTESKNY